MTTSTLSSGPATAAAHQLRTMSACSVLVPGDADYDRARQVWNGAVDSRPALMVPCRDDHDVASAVRAARQHDLPLSVRGGGHDWAGRALTEGGIVLDLSAMRAVTVDTANSTALAQGGATTGNVVAAARSFGLAPVTGTVKAVGMVGLTLAGGYGPLNGKHGLALDNLVEANVVLADGRRVTASDASDPDLYWALRGGGGTFGVVTAARYRLHPIETVLAGLILFPLSQAGEVLAGYRRVVAAAPDELTVMAGFMSGPDGTPLVFLFPVWSGDTVQGAATVARLERLGAPVAVQVAPMPYEEALGLFDQAVVNGRNYALQTRWVSELTDDIARLLIDSAQHASSPLSAVAVHHFHGAASRVAPDHTAFALRQDHLLVEILAAWEPTADADGSAHRYWMTQLSERLAPHALPGGYPNLLGPDEHQRVRLAYGTNAGRLQDLKRRYDPEGVFNSAVGTIR
jgi:FAD/FMN-containing dehydrogenase